MRQINYRLTAISVLSLFLCINLEAQVTIGSFDEPNQNALLELRESGDNATKGLLLPRVELTSLTDPSPLTMHIEGMVVYNIATNNFVTPGLYKNNGSKWILEQLPEGGTSGQFLIIDKETQAPKWTSLFIPEVKSEEFALMEVGAYSQSVGAELTSNSGAGIYTEGSSISSSWKSIIDPFKVTVKKKNNRTTVFVQTTILQESYSSSGWTSYAGGLFVNNSLKGVRVGILRSSGSNSELSKSETLFFTVENLPIGENSIQIAFIRRNSSPSTVPSLLVGKSLDQTLLGTTSLSYQYYEK